MSPMWAYADCEAVLVGAALLASHQPSEIQALQWSDPAIGPVRKAKEDGVRPSLEQMKGKSVETRHLLQLWDHLMLQDGIMYRRFVGTDRQDDRMQLVVPCAMRREILDELHSGAVGGHLGAEKTLSKLKERFYWPGHWKEVHNWCNTCARKTPAPKN